MLLKIFKFLIITPLILHAQQTKNETLEAFKVYDNQKLIEKTLSQKKIDD